MRHWMLARLASATRELGREVDEAWTASLERPTRASYRLYLAQLYGFQVPLEVTLVARSALEIRFLKPRIRSGRIAADLLALGIGFVEYRMLARQCPVPWFDEVDALGWLYVSERAMLYADQLRTHLAEAMPAELARASAYLTTYAGMLDQRWAELGDVLDRADPIDADRIVAAARDALATQLRWLTDDDAGWEPSIEVLPIAS